MVNQASAGSRASLLLFVCTTFVSAFLLFQVQPLLAKHILPWFGGSPSVWTLCMLFFQVVLIAGYAYSHLLESCLPVRRQAYLHLLLLALALASLPIIPQESWKPQHGEAPQTQILLLLLASVGLPYFVLSTTGTLFQAWFRRLHYGRSPYPLYALSNAGSLLALVSYPLAVEVWWSTDEQGVYWSRGFVLFALLCGAVALHLARHGSVVPAAEHDALAADDERSGGVHPLWLLLPALASLLLLALTNHLTQNVAVVPLLWVVPLSLYLLSFILCFESERWYRRSVWWSIMLGLLAVVAYSLFPGVSLSLQRSLLLYNAFFFAACMVCHGELVRLRPQGRALTAFYLHIAVGGALGGLFVALLAPLLFSDYLEFHLALALLYLLAPLTLLRGVEASLFSRRLHGWSVLYALGGSALGIVLYLNYLYAEGRYSESLRNFYGVLHVSELKLEGSGAIRVLSHGSVMHGAEFMAASRHLQPTTYYTPRSGVGQVMALTAAAGRARRIGVIGLGVGTLASYGQAADLFRFYELNPDVLRLARERFDFLHASAAQVETVLGDARLMLEAEPDQQFDILVVDAFSGDAIPVHLLTIEAFALYRRHLKAGGVICIHITNRHLDLRGPVAAAAAAFKFNVVELWTDGEGESGAAPARWMILSQERALLAALHGSIDYAKAAAHVTPWTDRRSNIFTLLK